MKSLAQEQNLMDVEFKVQTKFSSRPTAREENLFKILEYVFKQITSFKLVFPSSNSFPYSCCNVFFISAWPNM